MLKLDNVTLIALTNKDFEGHKRALDKSCVGIEWGGVKLIWDEGITGIDEWNRRIVFDLWKYVDTDYAMLIHADGYVINPDVWNPAWLDYDYIGAPWPLPTDQHSYRDPNGNIQRVGNSVSLRSKAMLQAPTFYEFKWQPYYGNTNEDGYLCVHNRQALETLGLRFAPLSVARFFSKEHEIPENVDVKTFAFHSL